MSTLQRLLKNTVAMSLSSFLRLGVGLVLTIYIARDLGPAFLGKYSLLVANINIFQILTVVGIPGLVTLNVARRPEESNRYFWNSLVVQLAASVVSAMLMIVVTQLLGYPADTRLMLILATGSLPAYAAFAAGAAILQAHERMEISTLAETVSSVGQVLAAIVVLRAGYGVVGLALVKVLGAVLVAAVNLAAVWALKYVRRPQIDLRFGWTLLRDARTLLMMTAFGAILLRLDVLIITQFWGEAVTGVYNAAYQLVRAFVLLVWAYADAIYPVLSRLFRTGPTQLRRAIGGSIHFGAVAILPLAVGATLLASPVIRLVYHDESFVGAAVALRLLIWHLLPFFAHTVLVRGLVAADRQDLAGRIEGIVLGAAIIYEIVLIYFFGMSGAAIAAFLTFLTAVALSWRALSRLIGRPEVAWRQVGFACVASAVLAGGLWVLGARPLWLVVPVGAVLYVALVMATGAIKLKELRAFVQ